MKALVVEDSPHIAERVVQMLRALEVDVVASVPTEDEGLAAVAAHRPDLAVVDLQLAQGTGFGVMRALRAANGSACIVVLTNHAVPALKVASFEAGADYFLDKSRDFLTLPRLVRELQASLAP